MVHSITTRAEDTLTSALIVVERSFALMNKYYIFETGGISFFFMVDVDLTSTFSWYCDTILQILLFLDFLNIF